MDLSTLAFCQAGTSLLAQGFQKQKVGIQNGSGPRASACPI